MDAYSHLIVGVRVSRNANDRNELVPTMASIPAVLGTPDTVLVDSGYINAAYFAEVEQSGIEPLVAMRWTGRPADPESKTDGRPRQWRKPRLRAMKRRMQEPEVRANSARRKCTVEPVFGMMRSHMGLRRFRLLGHDKVETEWMLTALADCRTYGHSRP